MYIQCLILISTVSMAGANTDDIDLLARITYAEAAGETIEGKIWVANVVRNRVETKGFPKTIKGVVYQKNAFQPVTDNSPLWKAWPGLPKEKKAVYTKIATDVLNGTHADRKVIAFRTVNCRGGDKYFNKLKLVKTMGRHNFYSSKI